MKVSLIVGMLVVLASGLFGCPTLSGRTEEQAGSTSGSWRTFAPLGEARQEVGVAELKGRVYVVGGILQDRTAAHTVEVYDPTTNSWSPVAPLPRRLHHVAVASVNERLYVIGGYEGLSFTPVASVFEYNPERNEWVEKAPLPTPRGALAAAVIEGKIYVAGGQPQRNSFSVYDPMANSWTDLAPMPTPRDHLAVGVIGGKLYAIGGRNNSSFTLHTLEVYDPAAHQWTRKADLPTGRSGIAAAVVRGCLYVFGGEGNDRDPQGVFRETEMYDPRTDSWQAMTPMPTPRHGIGAAVLLGRIHIPGGGPIEGFGVTNVHEAFQPPEGASCE
jgi:N-acetylneuraminic acid mutarotase